MGRFKTGREREAKAAEKAKERLPRSMRRGVSKGAIAAAARQAVAMLGGEK